MHFVSSESSYHIIVLSSLLLYYYITGQNDRNVRARTEKRKEPFKRNYKWVKSNICVVKSNHVAKSRPKAFSRNDKHVLLSDLCKDIKDVSQNTESTFAFGILLTIKSINTTPKTASNQFKKSNTDSNKANRMVTFLCPDSSAGQNICVMYFNKSTDWFDWDQGLRDDGTLRKCSFFSRIQSCIDDIQLLCHENNTNIIFLNIFLFILFTRSWCICCYSKSTIVAINQHRSNPSYGT